MKLDLEQAEAIANRWKNDRAGAPTTSRAQIIADSLSTLLLDAVHEIAQLRGEVSMHRALAMLQPPDMSYEQRSEFERLKHADVEQGKRIAGLLAVLDHERAEHRATGTILSNVNDAIGRAGIYCAITYVEAIDQIATERDRLRAALAKARDYIKRAHVRIADDDLHFEGAELLGRL